MTHDGVSDSALHPGLLTIDKVFNGKTRYLVPIYQRNYAWKSEEIEQMLDDLWDAMRDEKDYFLGNLIVTSSRGSAVSPVYEVIDGQQRLTTLYLLLSGLGHDGHTGRLQYESRPHATAALEGIARTPSDPAAGESPAVDHAIRQGHRIIEQYLERHLKQEGEKAGFLHFVLHKTRVVRIILPAKMDFNRYFEIMNTRGQQLQQVDIVKARLMAHLGDEAERACFAWIWGACAQMDTYVQMTLSRDNKELRSHIFGKEWSFLCVKDFDGLLLARHREIRSGRAESMSSHGAVGIDEAIRAYADPAGAEEAQNEDGTRFRSIIGFPFFLLHVLKLMQADASENEGHLDDKHLVKRFDEFLEVEGRDKRQSAKQFAFHLLRYRNLFDSYVIKREYTGAANDDGEWSLRKLIQGNSGSAGYVNTYSATKEENDTPDAASGRLLRLQSMLRVTYTSPRAMHWITLLLSLLDAEQNETQTIREGVLLRRLQDYAKKKVKETFFKGKYEDPSNYAEPSGFGIERIVFTYLDYLLLESAGRACFPSEEEANDLAKNFRFSFRDSIEHFYPQHPREGLQCKAAVSDEHLRHCLGNLALVSVSDNSRFSNDCPETKAGYKEDIINQSPKLVLMANAATRENSGWSDAVVQAHHKAIISLLENDLGLHPAGCS